MTKANATSGTRTGTLELQEARDFGRADHPKLDDLDREALRDAR